MECYPQNFGALVKRLAEEARGWAAAQAQYNAAWADWRLQAMWQLRHALEGERVMSGEGCQRIHDLAISAAAMTIGKELSVPGFEDREHDWMNNGRPLPEVSDDLWQRTQKLFLAGALLTCAELRGNHAEEDQQRRAYDRHGRAIVGFGPVGGKPRDAGDFAADAARVIPSTVVMFSGCQDQQTSADVSNVAAFGLPADSGPGGAGGACTSAMVKALSENPSGHTWVSLLDRMREILNGKYTQIPMLSSSRSMDLRSPYSARNVESNGRFRALLVGINYVGQQGELKGCFNDVHTMHTYLQRQGYPEGDTKVLMDDGRHEQPTKENILKAFTWLVQGAQAGDSLFFHYSGHGASIKDDNGDEEDGMDEALVPVDYKKAGLLRDDDVYRLLVAPLQEGAWLTCVLDCCHSGTILDLPYMFKADAGSVQAVQTGQAPPTMMQNPNFDVGKIMEVIKDHPGMVVGAVAGAAILGGVCYFVAGPEKTKVAGKAAYQVLQAEDKQAALLQAVKEAAQSGCCSVS